MHKPVWLEADMPDLHYRPYYRFHGPPYFPEYGWYDNRPWSSCRSNVPHTADLWYLPNLHLQDTPSQPDTEPYTPTSVWPSP